MPGRLGPRFAIEALFLIALAVGAAYADLERKWIVLVMAGGWLVVALLEATADRIWASAPPWHRPYYMALRQSQPVEPAVVAPPAPPAPAEPEPAPAPAAMAEPQPEPEPPPEPEPLPEPEPVPVPEPEPEAATVIVRPAEPSAQAAEQEAEPEPEAEAEAALPAEELPRPTLEPLEAAPKRRWFRRRKHEEEAVEDHIGPEPPKHVRLLPPSEQAGHAQPELEDTFETTEREERSPR